MKNKLLTNNEDRQNLNFILKLRCEFKTNWGSILKRKHQDMLSWMLNKTPKLDDNYSLATRLYWIMNGIDDFPTCPFYDGTNCENGHDCKVHRNVDSFEAGYFRACDPNCKKMQRVKSKKCQDTCQKRFGSSNFFSSDVGKQVKKKWCEDHGVENPFQLESVKKKAALTRKDHFGYEYTMLSPEKRQLASDNYKAKTGYSHQFINPSVIDKSNASKLKHKDINGKKRSCGNRSRRYDKFMKNDHIRPLFSKENFIQLDNAQQYKTPLAWKCLDCGNEFEACIDANFSSRDGIPVRCLKCHPLMPMIGISNEENEIVEFVKSLGLDVSQGDRTVLKPYELDIFIKSKNIAIEYDGLFWHSETNGNKPKHYHLMKTEQCESKSILLVHIFEDEWIHKKDIVKSRLKNLFGIYDKITYARKCVVKEVSSSDSKKFQDENHIQGHVNSKISLGLYENDELISLMTFGKCRFDKKHEWELLRFCNKLGYHIPGAAGKLLKHFEKTYSPKSLVSYADRRWSRGKLYEALGFKYSQSSEPNYFYLDKSSSNRMSRQKFQKHKLKSILKPFDPTKSEIENMRLNGYDRIFDCGNLVYVKMYS